MMERVALSAGRCGSECVEYSIKIKNAFNNEIRYNKEELMSTKEGHSGLGIKSVKSVVSKYQGEIRMDITDNMFSVLIIIPFHP